MAGKPYIAKTNENLSIMKITRVNQGISQRKLASLAHVSATTIFNLERGIVDGIRVVTLVKIARILNKKVYELFDLDSIEITEDNI